MPTKKPILQVVIDEEAYSKFKEICKNENSTVSGKANELIIEYITEKENNSIDRLRMYAEKLLKITKESTPN